MRERWKTAGGPLLAAAALFLLAGWHYHEAGNGARATASLWLTDVYLGLAAAALVFLALFALGILFWKRPLEQCACFAVLAFGSLYLAVLAPFSAPDENAHFASAYRVSSLLMGQQATDEDGRILVRRADEALLNIYGAEGDEPRTAVGVLLNQETYRLLREKAVPAFVGDDGAQLTAAAYRGVQTTPAAYLPQAIGIVIGRLLHVNGVILAYLGRSCNLIFYAVCVYWTVRLLPTGKTVFMGVSLLPMTLHEAASYSYDPFVMGLTGVFAAYCMQLAYVQPRVRRRDIAVLALLIAALGPCKIVYATVLGFALLIPEEKFGSRRNRFLAAGTVLASLLAVMAAINGKILWGYSTGSGGNYVAWAGTEGYTAAWIVRNPFRFVRLVYETLVHEAGLWTASMLGDKLGTMDPALSVPFLVLLGFAVCLSVLSVRRAGEALYLGGRQKAWICFLAAACLAGTMLAMMLSVTPENSSVIVGVQGRYLLPLLPFVLLCLKSERVVRTEGEDGRVLIYMGMMDCYVILRLFSVVCLRL